MRNNWEKSGFDEHNDLDWNVIRIGTGSQCGPGEKELLGASAGSGENELLRNGNNVKKKSGNAARRQSSQGSVMESLQFNCVPQKKMQF